MNPCPTEAVTSQSLKNKMQESPDEDESLELVPNITLNPSFNIDMLEHIAPDYTENSEHAFLVRADS